MRLLADLHVSPRTVGFLRALGHDVVRVNEVMPVTSTDEAIVLRALDDERVVLTQDLRFSAILGRAGQRAPSFDGSCRHIALDERQDTFEDRVDELDTR